MLKFPRKEEEKKEKEMERRGRKGREKKEGGKGKEIEWGCLLRGEENL